MMLRMCNVMCGVMSVVCVFFIYILNQFGFQTRLFWCVTFLLLLCSFCFVFLFLCHFFVNYLCVFGSLFVSVPFLNEVFCNISLSVFFWKNEKDTTIVSKDKKTKAMGELIGFCLGLLAISVCLFFSYVCM